MRRRDVLAGMASGGLALGLGGRASGARPAEVVTSRIAVIGPRVVMALTIEGRGPYPFLLDTGGYVSLINNRLAGELGLAKRGLTRIAGVGGAATAPVYLAKDVIFGGGARQQGVALVGTDLLGGGGGGGPLGALASGFLTSIDSDLDMQAGEWRAYPGGRPDRAGLTRVGKYRYDEHQGRGPRGSNRLFGPAAIDGRSRQFLLDTGAPRVAALDHPTARAMGLWNDQRPFAPIRPSGVSGQAGVARLVRADSLEFGSVRFTRPLVTLGAFGDRTGRGDGVIGLELLRHFNLSTDVRTGELWVAHHGATRFPDERYGMSGIWVDQRGDQVIVAAVGTGSPAAEAGVRTGDAVVGEPFRAVLAKLGARPGQAVPLAIERDGKRRDVSLMLRPYLD
jgi:hypothetical protein